MDNKVLRVIIQMKAVKMIHYQWKEKRNENKNDEADDDDTDNNNNDNEKAFYREEARVKKKKTS